MSNNNSSKTNSILLWVFRIIPVVAITIAIICSVVKINKIDHVIKVVIKEQNYGIHSHIDSIYNYLYNLTNISENNLSKEIYSAAHDASESFVNQTGNLLTLFGIMLTIVSAIICIFIPLMINREQKELYEKKIKEQQDQIDAIRTDFKNLIIRRREQTEKVDIHYKSTNMFAFKTIQSIIKITNDTLSKLENFDKYKILKSAHDYGEIESIINNMKNEGVSNSETYYELGKLYSVNQNTYDKACDAFREAVNNNVGFVKAYLEWASVLKKQNKLKESWEKREKAIHIMNLTKEKSELIGSNLQELQMNQNEIESLLFPDNSGLDTKKTIRVKKNVSFNMIFVKGGTFKLGETLEKEERYGLQPYQKHKVLLDNYYIGETVVTQKLWYAIMNTKPSKFEGDNLPVENVSWEEANEFIETLNEYPEIKMQGISFRLPTSAEWEYAARGGHELDNYLYSGNDDIDEVAWYERNSEQKTHPVKKKKPNRLKLYDMSGNVFEWCQDFWKGPYYYADDDTWVNPCCDNDGYGFGRICRGGGWGSSKYSCEVTSVVNGHVSSAIGFRLVLTRTDSDQ